MAAPLEGLDLEGCYHQSASACVIALSRVQMSLPRRHSMLLIIVTILLLTIVTQSADCDSLSGCIPGTEKKFDGHYADMVKH
jgi:hypothetical protein